MVGEVLELDDDAREQLLRGRDEFLDELVERGTRQAPLAQADVQRVVQQPLVVGAGIQHDRQALPRMNAGTCRVQGQLADRYAHAVGAEVAEPEDAFAVGDDDDARLAEGPVAHDLDDSPAVRRRDEHAARPPVDVPELLAGQPDRRGVDDRHHFIRVFRDHPEEQRLVAVVQRFQKDVARQVRVEAPEILEHPVDLVFLGADMGRQQAAQPERVPFPLGERRALVQRRVAQQGRATGEPARQGRWQGSLRRPFFHGSLRQGGPRPVKVDNRDRAGMRRGQ